MSRVANPYRQPWIVGALLLALVVRALVPAGFMPATDRPFSFQICPDGFPAHMLRVAAVATQSSSGDESQHAGHHHHQSDPGAHHDGVDPSDDGTPHRHAAAGMEHCAFAGAAGPALLAWIPAFSAPAIVTQAPDFVYVTPTLKPLRFRVQQPRGPPALA